MYVVLYTEIMKVYGFLGVIYPQKQIKFYFLTLSQYWLGIVDPKMSSDQSLPILKSCYRILIFFFTYSVVQFF